ncbi:MAG: DUF4262 domain-containing protein [Phycisphaerae bacterium]
MTPEQSIANDVTAHGHSLILISDAKPPFAYTVGLMFTLSHPELILFGRTPDELSTILRAAITHIRRGTPFTDRSTHTLPGFHIPLATRRVHPSQHEHYLGYAMGYCRSKGRIGQLEALQVFWPDPTGLFPFDRGCDDTVWSAQPRLDQPLMPDIARERRRALGDM